MMPLDWMRYGGVLAYKHKVQSNRLARWLPENPSLTESNIL